MQSVWDLFLYTLSNAFDIDLIPLNNRIFLTYQNSPTYYKCEIYTSYETLNYVSFLLCKVNVVQLNYINGNILRILQVFTYLVIPDYTIT